MGSACILRKRSDGFDRKGAQRFGGGHQVAREVDHHQHVQVGRWAPSGWPGDKRVEALREAIKKDFGGAFFGPKVPQDPHVRGHFGEARIDLKEGATPVPQKPFVLHGERWDAHKKVAQDCLDNGFIEPIPGEKANAEWLSMTSPVPKKTQASGKVVVVDMRRPNIMTRRANYPLPVIEDLMVRQGANHMF